jgi:phospho-N-acetylmuramoyl-pentapeptide-transferase
VPIISVANPSEEDGRAIFMGDCGSLALGGSLCSLFCLFQAPLLLLGILIVPVLETLSVIIQIASYRLTGKRFFKMAPIHHHFEQLDYHESHITTRFFLLNTFCCILTLSSLLPR